VDPKIDELLSSSIDGELTPRQQTEVQRLAAHDPRIKQHLRQLQKCKMLLGSLPFAKAPARMLEDIKAALEKRTSLSRQLSPIEELAGQRHLLIRKVLAAAAIIGLVAVLASVIYTILAPPHTPQPPIIATHTPPAIIEPVKSAPTTMAAQFSARLELQTGTFVEVDAAINRAIADNDFLDCTVLTRQPDSSEYLLTCSPKGLNLLLADLEGIWPRLDSATLLVQPKEFGRPVAVNAVTPRQIGEIAAQDSIERSIETAKDFNVLNNMVELLPGKEVAAAISDRTSSLVTTPIIPKPVLTAWPKTIKKPSGQLKTGAKISIVITAASDK